MTSRDQLVQQVLRELQEAVESEGLEGLVSAALEAKHVLSSFTLPTCREGGPDLQVLEVDSVALSLYPDDAPRNMLPLVCKGEGSLLFEAASMLLWGDASLSLELRARTVVEMLLHRHYYLQGMIDSKVMLQAVRHSLRSEESPEMTSLSPATLEAIFDADVKATCFPTSFSNVWHLYALASVLQRNIYSIYPMRNLKIRPYFNRVIRPRRCDHVPSTLHIMWAGQPLSSHFFRHQYFAPVVGLEEVEAEAPSLAPASPALAPRSPLAKTLELLNREPGLSYSNLCERYSVTKSTFYRWRRQSQEHRQKVATRFSAKHFLQDSFHRGGVVPLQQFLQRFPDISRSTYYAWKHELLGSGSSPALAPKEELATEEMEKLPEKQVAEGLGCSSLVASSPGIILMQRAKLYLEHCISLNMLIPYRCFKRRFPSISRSTYYNWRRKALRRNPSFKPAPALSAAGAAQPVSAGDEALLPWKGEEGEGAGKAMGGGTPGPRELLPLKVPLSRWQRRLRRAARKQVLSGHLPFCRFRLRYPTLSPSTFWVWKSLARGWSRGLSKLQMQASALGKGRQEAEEKQEKEVGGSGTAVLAPHAGTLPVGARSGEDPVEPQGGPSREGALREGTLQEGATAQGQPHGEPLSSHPVVAAAGGSDGRVVVMDMITTTKFKAQAKLFLQKRFQSKSFPSYKEFSALFPLTARSTYYMWKRALYDGLTLVDG
ncbi:PREDICTED: vertnin [Propithecus coquereli]|uniref:vertnin n=1 Tax=Propithecus coquereli TaxID=379532 RepID=UPI00063F3B7B|nr:PREDICTED: vertnin [Propithecus coquereli]XP_012511596.1 PREDICTED: vertnin [Propithecus coquereli]